MSVDPTLSPGEQPGAAAPVQAPRQPPAVPNQYPASEAPYQPPVPAASTDPAAGEQAGAVSYDHPSSEYPTAVAGSYSPPVESDGKNWMGIVAIVGAFLFPPVGIVFGHLALGAANQGLASNRGVAVAALVVGYVFAAIGIVWGTLTFTLLASGTGLA